MFFQVNSLHRAELEVVDCVLHEFNQTSSVNLLSPTLTYIEERPLSSGKEEEILEISFLLVLLL